MEKEFVPYELSVKLKALGFNEPCLGKFYTKPKSKMFGVDEKGRHYPIKNTPKKLYTLGEYFVLNENNVIIAPLYQQAFRWFREKYGVHSSPRKYDETKWWVEWGTWTSPVFETFEEAELACLTKLIEIVETKNK